MKVCIDEVYLRYDDIGKDMGIKVLRENAELNVEIMVTERNTPLNNDVIIEKLERTMDNENN